MVIKSNDKTGILVLVSIEAWNEDDLSNEEMKYYLDVNNRVMKMLVDVAD